MHFEGVCSVLLFEKSLGMFGMGKMFRSFFCFAVTDSESLVEEDNREPFQQNTCAYILIDNSVSLPPLRQQISAF